MEPRKYARASSSAHVLLTCALRTATGRVCSPSAIGWGPVVRVEHYHVSAEANLEAANE